MGKYLGRYHDRVCSICKLAYQPETGSQKYCSFSCRIRGPKHRHASNLRNVKFRHKHSDKNRYIRLRRKYWIEKYKQAKGCYVCGWNKNTLALDFDHINPDDKKYTIGNKYKHTIKSLIAEIRKCRILCTICHRIETAKNNHYFFSKDKEKQAKQIAVFEKFKRDYPWSIRVFTGIEIEFN